MGFLVPGNPGIQIFDALGEAAARLGDRCRCPIAMLVDRVAPMEPVFTVGHGTRTSQELIELLRAAQIDLLVDVRRFPGSRRHPHFSRAVLERDVQATGIDYEWWGETLGGRRDPVSDSPHVAWRNGSFRAYADHMGSEEFRGALAEIERRAAESRQAVMCAETLWWKCHRRLIADALVADGCEVIHLGVGATDDHHRLSESARVDARGNLVYDVEPQRRLPL